MNDNDNEIMSDMNIFLSASVPEAATPTITKTILRQAQDKCQEAIEALVEEWIVGKGCRIVWGGHPTIEALEKHGLRMSDWVVTYQSREFEAQLSSDDLGLRIYTEKRDSREESLRLMRERMIGENEFVAAVFIGGKEGVREEYELFRKLHPSVPYFVMAGTGGVAAELM